MKGDCMTVIYPNFTKHPDKAIRFLEASAIKKLVYAGSYSDMYKAHPDIENGWPYWAEHYSSKAKQAHKDFMRDLNSGVYPTIDDFYEGIKKLLKPIPKGKALRDKKKRTAQKAYQQEKLGDAFIDNMPLLAEAKMAARELADNEADEDAISIKAKVLAEIYAWSNPLTDLQIQNLINYIKAQMEKHLKLDRIEAKILDENNKNLYFMYGQIKRRATVGDTLELGISSASKIGRCSRSDVKPILKKLESLGFINCIQKGRQGSQTGRSAIYRREA